MSGRDDVARRGRHERPQPKLPPGAVVPKVALSYEEAAWSLGISRSKLYRLVSEGRLPCVVIDGNTVLRPEDLRKFVSAHVAVRGVNQSEATSDLVEDGPSD